MCEITEESVGSVDSGGVARLKLPDEGSKIATGLDRKDEAIWLRRG